MLRIILWALAAFYLLLVGLCPAAAAPLGLAFGGLAVIVGLIPGPILALAAVVLYLRHRPASTPRTA